MATINSSEQLIVRGTLDVSPGTLTAKAGQIPRSYLTQDADVAIGVPVTDLRKTSDLAAVLPNAASGSDLGIYNGGTGFGTDAPVVRTSDAKATTVTQYARFQWVVGSEFDVGETLQVRVNAGMNTTVANGTATVDVEAYVIDEDGTVGSDICATAAKDINLLTKANKDFTLTSSTVAKGDVLDIRVTVAITDSATATAVIGEIGSIRMLRDIRG